MRCRCMHAHVHTVEQFSKVSPLPSKCSGRVEGPQEKAYRDGYVKLHTEPRAVS